MTTLVELCAGTAAVSLWALGRCSPLTGFMGSKRRWAPTIVESLGIDRPQRVVLLDAGPWGDAWGVLRTAEGRDAVRYYLHDLDAHPPEVRWSTCLEAPSVEPGRRVAYFLWLQARSAGTIPVWWSVDNQRWESPTGARTELAHNRGGGARARRQKGAASALESSRRVGIAYSQGEGGSRRTGPANPKALRELQPLNDTTLRTSAGRCRGIQHPRTIAQRIVALSRIDWSRVEVVHGDARNFDPIPGSTVFMDPPYRGCPRYAALLPRADVLEVALRHHAAGARVAVSEGEGLDLAGWHVRRLQAGHTTVGGGGRVRRAEYLTASWPLALCEQLSLLEVA